MTETWDIPRVPVFQSGDSRHGEPWNDQELIDMVRNDAILNDRLRPQIGIGHEKNTGEPSVGRPKNLSFGFEIVDGAPVGTLFADLKGMPPVVAEAVRAGFYDTCSMEADRVTIAPSVYAEPPEGCEHVKGPIFRGLALLGRTQPQVKTLGQLSEILKDRGTVTSQQFSERLAARPKVRLRQTKLERAGDGRVLCVFSEVVPVSTAKPTIKPLAEWTEKGRTALKKFSEGGDTQTLTRDDLVSILLDCGYSAEDLPDVIPDSTLAAMVRVQQMTMQQASEKPTEAVADTATAGGDTTTAGSDTTSAAGADTTTADGEDPAKKKPAAVQMSEAAIVAKLTEAFDLKINAIRQELGATDASVAATQKIARQTEADTKTAGARAFCEKLSEAGKLCPAMVPDAIELLAAADAVTTHKFSEGTITLHDKLRAFFEKAPKFQFGEKIPSRHATDDQATADADAEAAKVRSYYSTDTAKPLLEAQRQTPDHYVKMFSEQLKANPKLTAKQFCGAE